MSTSSVRYNFSFPVLAHLSPTLFSISSLFFSPLFSSPLFSSPLFSSNLSDVWNVEQYCIILYCIALYYIVLQSIVLYKIGSRLSAVISLFPLLPPSLQFLLSLFFYPHSNPYQINHIQLYST